ncbi:cupin domain-containing protein [Saccharothrix luteola]|uniref:cupin domain-containing protein n=1 Tax=Saccharothrix luteola TaxID=2893018 RepID=UPI001E5A2F2B|nr:cupin domain-containing protein [Saccharothrix luteola]MCC8242710.1 cupin domain-containing protein [Saccharothrix luteola]
MPYRSWIASGDVDDPDALSLADDAAVLEHVNSRPVDDERPLVVVEPHFGLAPRVRFLCRDIRGTAVEIALRPPIAGRLDLLPHPEGGWAREIWHTGHAFRPEGYPAERESATALQYALGPGERSRWHVVRPDELWLWQSGAPLRMLLGGRGEAPADPEEHILGGGFTQGHTPNLLVPAGTWQAAEPAEPAEVLITCVVSPGWDQEDYRILEADHERS